MNSMDQEHAAGRLWTLDKEPEDHARLELSSATYGVSRWFKQIIFVGKVATMVILRCSFYICQHGLNSGITYEDDDNNVCYCSSV
jgi:hypothetical protein